ncbi:Hydroxyproline-rich glycoprotein family protein [Tripterygium wilfordii]|uniref:Hydroxyproline-rich glycoprotein family protein n=1 Tax=Tripterygium wilfordii TaxID=458696 RepID=A0A7J7C8P5_TRIWF|nr:Hydroxyproline-rich glycoprotein family protein [Tripterygium wilfordii]
MAMAGENEPAKLLLPYLQRADELQKHEPLVAYYCRLFGMEKGLRIPQSERTKTTNALLVSLMNQLEKDKKSLKLSPEDSLHLEGFALNVFAKADKQDHAGRADMSVIHTSVSTFEMIFGISCFGQSSPQRLPKESSDEQNVSITTSVIEFIKQSLKREKTKKKQLQQFNPEDKQQLKVVSLQDWILDSPRLNEDCPNFGEQVLKQFSVKVYPCLVQEKANFSYNPRESFSQERLLKDFEVDTEELEECSLSKRLSKKAKKRVSFRLPEESDIFIFYPDEDELEH